MRSLLPIPRILSSKDVSIFRKNRVFTRHCQGITFDLGDKGVFAFSDIFGFYSLSVSWDGVRWFHVHAYVGDLTPQPPFYLWVMKNLKIGGHL